MDIRVDVVVVTEIIDIVQTKATKVVLVVVPRSSYIGTFLLTPTVAPVGSGCNVVGDWHVGGEEIGGGGDVGEEGEEGSEDGEE